MGTGRRGIGPMRLTTSDHAHDAPSSDIVRTADDRRIWDGASGPHSTCVIFCELVMGKVKCAFTKTAVKRALEAAKEVGVDVQIVIDQEHKTMTITPVKMSEADNGVGDDLDQWMKKHARATEGD
jgi:hypothetical protein